MSEQQKTELDITGMTCAACSSRIERVLNKMEGVDLANVNLATEKASISYDPSILDVEKIIARIDKLGYGAFEKVNAQETADLKERAMKVQLYKFIAALLLSLPLLWTMVAHFNLEHIMPVPSLFMNPWFQLALATPVQFIIGYQFYVGAYKALRNGSANMDVLVVLGTSAAYFYSIYQMMTTHHAHLYFETSAVLITLILLGKLFEARAKGRSSSAIKTLMKLQAKSAVVIRDGEPVEVRIEEVAIGDLIQVKPGGKIPVDGEVVSGRSAIDESMLSGESIPVDKVAGDIVYGATMNKSGTIQFKATKVGKDTALSQIIQVVEDAQGQKAPIQRLADKISGIFVPIVVAIAVIAALVWYFFIAPGDVTKALEILISILVIACPCALGLATPTSIMAGSGRAAEYGILFKGGEYLETTGLINTVVIDKTGTITNGTPELTDVITYHTDKTTLLEFVKAAEKASEHPLAQAIVTHASSLGIRDLPIEDFRVEPGFGVYAKIESRDVYIGTRRLMDNNNINFSRSEQDMIQLEQQGKTAMLVAIDGELYGIIAVADTVKETSKEAIRRLHELNMRVIMLTGDNEYTANAIAQEVGIDEVIAQVLPEDKARVVKQLSEQTKVAMVGDGINDAPALATAHIGMALGTGTDVAMEAADITLIRGDLNSIADAFIISKKTMKNIKQNLFWAFLYNAIGIPIAAAGLLAPWIAGAAMAFSSVSVVLNALRLQRVKLHK